MVDINDFLFLGNAQVTLGKFLLSCDTYQPFYLIRAIFPFSSSILVRFNKSVM